MKEQYSSPVALPIVEGDTDDYRVLRPNRKWLLSVLVNGKRYFFGTYTHWVSEKTYCPTVRLSGDVLHVNAFDTYPQARHAAAMYLTEPTGNGFEMRASATRIQKMLGLDIKPRVKIEIAMIETTEMEPAWRTAAYRISHQIDPWHAQYWTDLS